MIAKTLGKNPYHSTKDYVYPRFQAIIKYDKQAKVYVAHAPELGISSQGTSEQEAQEALSDAIRSYLIVVTEKQLVSKQSRKVTVKTISGHVDAGWVDYEYGCPEPDEIKDMIADFIEKELDVEVLDK